MRLCLSYIRYIIMFHMAKRSGIQSIFCDFTHATTSSLVIHSRFSHFVQRPVSCFNPQFINHETCQIRVNLNLLEINHDHFPSMSSPNFRLSGGSLGYWTACNNFKHYCTLPLLWPCCLLWASNGDLVGFMVARGRHSGRRLCVRGVLETWYLHDTQRRKPRSDQTMNLQ